MSAPFRPAFPRLPRPPRRTLLGAGLLGAGLACLPAPALAQDAAATAVVEGFHGVLLEVMRAAQNAGLGVRGRFERLRPVMDRAFDLPAMARIAVGPPWARMTAAQQEALVAAFSEWSVATYANRFDGYSGESFATLGEAPAASGSADRLVRTRLNRTGGEAAVLLSYLMRRTDGWRIVDVFLTGTISEIASRRAEFTALLRGEGGADGLIAELRRRAAAELRG